MPVTTHILVGKKAIKAFMGRGWAVIEKLILHNGFPARKVEGIWESDSDLITAWRRGRLNSPKKPENPGKSAKKPSKRTPKS